MSDRSAPVTIEQQQSVSVVSLNDPDRRNALGLSMFDALRAALDLIADDDAVHVVMICGKGHAFCAGFDLASAVETPSVMGQYIERLSGVNRQLRRMPQVVVAVVQGAAIAGGCALLGACDFVIVTPDATLGYPVHRIGVSPAVTIPTLQQAIGPGAARSLLMGGELITGREAKRIGLATHLCTNEDTLQAEAMELCQALAAHPPGAMRATKAWLNELDGSLDDVAFDGPVRGSVALTTEDEAVGLLRRFWRHRR